METDIRDRSRTPFFVVPCGPDSTAAGIPAPGKSPGRTTVEARALVGQLVGDGRYLLRAKTGHSAGTVCYAAHDLWGGIDVTLEIHPDDGPTGYRVGRCSAEELTHNLPDLYRLDYGHHAPVEGQAPNWGRRAWHALRRALRRSNAAL